MSVTSEHQQGDPFLFISARLGDVFLRRSFVFPYTRMSSEKTQRLEFVDRVLLGLIYSRVFRFNPNTL